MGNPVSTLAPVASAFDLETLVAAVAAEDVPINLWFAVLHEDGYENVVLETIDGWMLRFPRRDDLPFERELAILNRVAGRLPVPTPRVEFTGERTRFLAYRKLSGAWFDREAYLDATAERRDVLAASLAAFLVAMHAEFTADEVTALGIPAVNHRSPVRTVLKGMGRLPREYRPVAESLLERYAATWTAGTIPGPRVVLHNDFHTWNMVFAPPGPVWKLDGIWDFSCVQVGEPTFDLRYLDKSPRDLLDRVAGQYEAMTGWRVDPDAAVVASRMEQFVEALHAGRFEILDAASASWELADSGR